MDTTFQTLAELLTEPFCSHLSLCRESHKELRKIINYLLRSNTKYSVAFVNICVD